MRLVTGLVKDRLLGCMGQVLQRGLWQGKEEGWDKGDGDKVSIDKELVEVGRVAESDRGVAWKKVASGGIREDMVTFFEDTPQRMKTRVVGSD